MHPTVRELYFALLEEPCCDRMLVLADAIEEYQGDDALAWAFRWAATERILPAPYWPFARTRRQQDIGDPRGLVYDWDSRERESGKGVPSSACLPHSIYKIICSLSAKKYGSVMDAFILLARALPEKQKVTNIRTKLEFVDPDAEQLHADDPKWAAEPRSIPK